MLGFLVLFPACALGVDYDAEIAALAVRPQVQAAMDWAAEREAGNLPRLIEITEIAAPPFGEAARGRRFAEMLGSIDGIRVEIDAVGNVLGYRPGRGVEETLAVVAHLDTVFPAGTDVRVRGPELDEEGHRRWYAPGIADDSRGLVLLLTLAETLAAARINTVKNLLFVGSVGEEGNGDLRGVKHLFREGGPRIDEMIAIDGGNDRRVLNQAVGSHRYRVRITGPGGHSWGAFGMANPAHALASGIHRFEAAARSYVAAPPRTSFNIGRIGGGTSVNAIPFESWAEVDMRSESGERLKGIDALLRESFAAAVAEHNERRNRGSELTLDFESTGKRPSGVVPPDTPLIARALAASRFLGLEPKLGSGSTDANVPISLGIPATTISRGGIGGAAHSLGEWWSDHEVVTGTHKALLLLVASVGLSD
jgi:acetylornithine deacetylase/succinyl-diaminopimelate desuccinylase-like protein